MCCNANPKGYKFVMMKYQSKEMTKILLTKRILKENYSTICHQILQPTAKSRAFP